MKDRDISAGTAIATALWGVALVLLIATWCVPDRRLAVTTVVTTGIAMTATTRSYFVAFTNTVKRALRLEGDVTSIR